MNQNEITSNIFFNYTNDSLTTNISSTSSFLIPKIIKFNPISIYSNLSYYKIGINFFY